MSISDWYSDDELISQLQMFFDSEEEEVDFKGLLGTVTEVDDSTLELKVKGRTFRFGKEICSVTEVN